MDMRRILTQLSLSLSLAILLVSGMGARGWSQATETAPPAAAQEQVDDQADPVEQEPAGPTDAADVAPRERPRSLPSRGDTVDEPTSDVAKPSAEDEAYYELLKLFADTLDQVERNYVEEVSRRELMEAAIQGVLAKLDQYSDYIPPDQLDKFRTGVENEFGGIGIRVGVVDGKLTVITPLIGTPAYRAGVLTGDQILAIGDANAEGMSLEDAIKMMKGPTGTNINLTVLHKDDEARETVTVPRELVRMESVLGDRRNPDDTWDFMFDQEKKIGYVRITSFSRHTAEDLQVALERLTADGMKGLILDLRFNPGGLLSAAVEVADMFLTEGIIVSTSGRNVPDRSWSASETDTFQGFKMVVLVNGYSASASEIVAASLQDHERAVVIGERTWGKGSVQNIIELEGGRSALKLTTAGYKRPSGKNIDRFEGATEDDDWGVRPNEGMTVTLPPNELRQLLTYQRDRDILATPAEKKAGTTPARFIDSQLQSALDYLAK